MAARVSSPVFVGRAGELARLEAMLDRAAAGHPGVVVIGGEAGVGKTRLVTELIERTRTKQTHALVGGCVDVRDGVVPYAPVVEALRGLLASVDAVELDRVLGNARGCLARLVPDLASSTETGARAQPDPGGPGPLFELALGALSRLADQRPALFVVEDLQWADRSTRDLVTFLVRNLRAGVLMALTYRSDDVGRAHPLRRLLAELDRTGRVERIELARIGRRDLGRLLAGIVGRAAGPTLVGEIMARSEGNPFFAEELLAGHLDGVALTSVLRELVLTRVQTLSEPAQAMLATAAVAGRRVDHDLLAEVCRLPPGELVGPLREAIDRHVLVVEPAAAGESYAFRHALVQEALYDDLLAAQRVTLHAAYATAMTGRVNGPVALGQLAHHWFAARDADRALPAYVQAGLAAEHATAPAEAMAFYTRAADLWPRARTTRDSPLDRAELFGRAAAAAHVTGDIARAITLARHALAELGASADRLRTGALLARIARYHWDLPDNTGAMTIIEQAVDAVSEQPPTAERATVLATHSRLLLLAGRIDEARARSDEAIAVARHVGARAEEGQALNTLGVAYGDLGDVDLAIARLEEARRVAEEVGAPQELCSVHHNLATTLVGFGRHTEAVTVGLTACRLARRFGLMRGAGAHTQANMAGTLLWLGRWDEADRLLAEILDLDLPAVNLVIGVLTRARARLWRGDVDGARDDLTRDEVATVVSQEPAIATDLYILLAELNTWRGRFAEARTAVRDGLVVAAGAAPVVGVCLTGISAEAAAAEHARARHAADEADAAVESAARLRELAHRTADDRGDACPPFVTAMLCAANAEWTRARGPSSAESWGVAADAWDQESFPYPAAYARWRQAEALLAGGPRHQAATTAAPILAAARQTAERLGARRLISEIESLARRARVDLHPATADTDRTAEPAKEPIANLRLTPREREVLELLAEGLTNRQIADRLYISDKTASVHVSNILTKLGVANRGQAAATAHRLGLTP